MPSFSTGAWTPDRYHELQFNIVIPCPGFNVAPRASYCPASTRGDAIGLRFMTISQLEHHAEQMDAARAEFKSIWKPELLTGLGRHEAIRIETLCWQFFLHGKGLRK